MYTLAVGTLCCIADENVVGLIKCWVLIIITLLHFSSHWSLHALQCWLGNKVLSVDYHNLVAFFKSLIIACASLLWLGRLSRSCACVKSFCVCIQPWFMVLVLADEETKYNMTQSLASSVEDGWCLVYYNWRAQNHGGITHHTLHGFPA